MIVFCVANQKGGVGKSSTADALAAYLSREKKGAKVLAIDMDSQCNLTASYGINPYDKPTSIREVLAGAVKASEAVTTTRGDIIPGSLLMIAIDEVISGKGKYQLLQKALSSFEGVYDYVVIDTPPGINTATINAFFAADVVLIPAVADMFTFQGIGELLKNIAAVQKDRPALKVGGILLTRHNPRGNITQFATKRIRELAENSGAVVFDAFIRECLAIREAQAMGQSIFDYAPKSNAAFDYSKAFKELSKQLKKN